MNDYKLLHNCIVFSYFFSHEGSGGTKSALHCSTII